MKEALTPEIYNKLKDKKTAGGTKTKYNKQLHNTLKAEIDEQDSHRSINLKQTDAFLYNWIYE